MTERDPAISKENNCKKHHYGMWKLLILHNAVLETCSCEECGVSRIRRVRLDETILKEIFNPEPFAEMGIDK